ncbi:hypothetical protein OsI_10491 [Oryza sativa Indica Group]|uniref:Uncharacterized protein n=1 Tax=Oryza sativa subsp. indica TaxID=39946 RepID=A2XDU9_ORYSI|nr:hypothetical protein OsI_10491 [Oryza sativa Indica Group]
MEVFITDAVVDLLAAGHGGCRRNCTPFRLHRTPLPLSLSLTALAAELLAVTASLTAAPLAPVSSGRRRWGGLQCHVIWERRVRCKKMPGNASSTLVATNETSSNKVNGVLLISVLIDEKKKDVETDRAHINRRTGRLVGPCMPVQVLDGSMNS